MHGSPPGLAAERGIRHVHQCGRRRFTMTEHFVQVRGTQLIRQGFTVSLRRHQHVVRLLPRLSRSDRKTRSALSRTGPALRTHGITNIRIMASSENSAIAHAVRPPIMRSPDDVDEDLLCGLDFILARMAERDMRAVLYLTNFWDWSGGMSSYNVWATGDPGIDPGRPGQHMGGVRGRYRVVLCERTRAGIVSCADPPHRDADEFRSTDGSTATTRRSWRGNWRMNRVREPAGPWRERNLPHMIRWIDETAAYIHALDPQSSCVHRQRGDRRMSRL